MKYLKISLGIFLTLAASRFIPHPPNFTSLIALSFYVPALLGLRYLPALVISFVITDLIIGFHSTVLFTWGSVLIIGIVSKYLFNSGSSSFRYNKNSISAFAVSKIESYNLLAYSGLPRDGQHIDIILIYFSKFLEYAHL